LLHLVVEFSGSDSGDFHLGVQQALQGVGIVAVQIGLEVTAIGNQLQPGAAHRSSRTDHQVRGADEGMHSDRKRVEPGANQIVERGRQGLGRSPVIEQRDAISNDQRTKTLTRRPAHQNAISGRQTGGRGRPYKDGSVAVLNEKQVLIAAEVANRRLECHRESLARLSVAEGMNGAQ
jgi:hypothetical protein